MEFARTETIPEGCEKWAYKPMTKTNANGSLVMWKIGFENPEIVIRHGHVDGAIQVERVEVVTNTSGRSVFEQALLEINNRYLNKHRQGYRAENEPPALKGPMLANKFELNKTKLSYPVGCTVKLDGIRCLIRRTDEGIMYRSRNNKEYKHLSVFDESMNQLMDLLPPGVELDGEMFSEDLTFNEISSVFRREKNTDNELIKKHIKYYVFDCNIEKSYEDRWGLLLDAYKKLDIEDNMIVLVNTFWAYSQDDIQKFHQHAREKGFEGTMIRKLYVANQTPKGLKDSLYLSGRKSNILKYKDIEEEEGDIIGVEQGKGREVGIALVKLRDVRGNEFVVRPSGTFEKRKQWFENPSLIIGKKMTYQYQNLSETGVPRFPVGKGIRDYE